MSLVPTDWGPHYWYVLHTYASVYPEPPDPIDVDVATNLIKGLPFMLPCQECAIHALEYIKAVRHDIPRIVSSRANLETFMRDFHNSVNARIGKPFYA